jgi:hypothetical protein
MELPRLHIVDAPPGDLPESMILRDAALWIGTTFSASSADVSSATLLSDLPWKMVLIEDSGDICSKISGTHNRQFEYLRGHKIPFASGITDISFPAKSVPLFFLNGRTDAIEMEQRPEALGKRSREFRRASMFEELVRSGVKNLVVLPGAMDSLGELLGDIVEEMRPHVVALAPTAAQEAILRQWSEKRPGATSVTICRGNLAEMVQQIARSIQSRISTDRLILRVRDPRSDSIQLMDCTGSAPLDSPIFDDFTVLEERHIATVADDALLVEEIDSFFARSGDESSDSYWRPFAAGLPFERDDGSAGRKLLATLSALRTSSNAEVKTLVVESEPGAGGTTTARALALLAARQGYPTLVARTASAPPNAEILSTFLSAVGKFAQDQWRMESESKALVSEKSLVTLDSATPFPWLVVFDIEHWQGREELLPRFIQILRKYGHRAALVLVREASVYAQLPTRSSRLFDEPLSHEMNQSDVERLGKHLNRFLEPVGHARSLEHWYEFWKGNALIPEPGMMGVSDHVASFWVTLEFWLRKQLNLGESIQQWLYTGFLEANYRGKPLIREARIAVLMIAAMSVERAHLPEQCLPIVEAEQDPLSFQLTETAHLVPALGLVRRKTAIGHSWGIAHVPLARHLLEAASEDVSLLQVLGVDKEIGSVQLRLHLLSLILKSKVLAQKRFRDLAVRFAQSILKLDRAGNQEFARYWRDVFNALYAADPVLWNVSRAFNHHVSISRRRVAVDNEFFPDKTPSDKLRLLEDAVSDLEYALSVDRVEGDDTDLNLLNSLARACQDLSSLLESENADPARVSALRARELDCLQQAEHLNPSNSFVLETSARSLLVRAKTEPQNAIKNACAALQKISVARRLEGAGERNFRLDELTEHAYEILALVSDAELSSLRIANHAVAAMIAAWLHLRRDSQWSVVAIANSPGPNVEAAISELSDVPSMQRDWPLNRLLYDLVAIQHPTDFERQLSILQTLEGTPAMQIQLRLERAILFYMIGAFERGRREFSDVRIALSNSEAIVDVPRRLGWYFKPGTTDRAICDGRVVRPPPSWNKHALEVAQLGHTIVIFNPLDFGYQSLPIGNQRKCMIGFNFRGPYAVPTSQDRR